MERRTESERERMGNRGIEENDQILYDISGYLSTLEGQGGSSEEGLKYALHENVLSIYVSIYFSGFLINL